MIKINLKLIKVYTDRILFQDAVFTHRLTRVYAEKWYINTMIINLQNSKKIPKITQILVLKTGCWY